MFYVHSLASQVPEQQGVPSPVVQVAPFAPAGPLAQHLKVVAVAESLLHAPEQHSLETSPDVVSVVQVFVSAPLSPRAQHSSTPCLSLLHVPEQHSVEPVAASVVHRHQFFVQSSPSFMLQ